MERFGRYEILDTLGRGSMGTVYRARDPKIDRVVAIKTVTTLGLTSHEKDDYRLRFFREAQAAGKLAHPNLVTIYDVGEEETTHAPYIVMEYIEGRTLESLIDDSTGEPVPVALDRLKQVAEALDYAHTQGIVHRDIKPANIIVTPQGRAKITDFGIAKLAATQITMPGESPGTPSYMSPEQVTGEPVDGRSDLFSLGIILYRILTGQKPFAGESAATVMFNIAYKEPVRASQLNPSLDPRLDYVMQRALAKDPGHRYQRGREFADDLEDLCHDRTPRSQSGATIEATAEGTVVQKRPQALSTRVERETSVPVRLSRAAASLGTQASRRVRVLLRRVPWQVTLAIVAISLALLALKTIGPAKTASLDVRCVHEFRTADLFVWVDGDLVCEGNLAGAIKRRLGFIRTVQGSFSETIALAPGRHVIRVQVTSEDEGYNQTKELEGVFVKEGKKTLGIGFASRNKNLSLTLE